MLDRGLRIALLTNPSFSRTCIECRMGWGDMLDMPFELVTTWENSTRCKPCAYPEPCRFPGRRLVSMEAAGLLVTDACNAAGVPYNHGRLTIAYTGCALLRGSSPSDAAEPSSRA